MQQEDLITIKKETAPLKDLFTRLKAEGKVSIAILFGSLASGRQHARSDIDLALCINPWSGKEQIEIIDKILMAVDRNVSIPRLDEDNHLLLLNLLQHSTNSLITSQSPLNQ